jgi:RHS repeat-associated protein
MINACIRISVTLLWLAVLVGVSSAQQNVVGAQPFGTFGGGPELINLGNLDVNWTIPIISKNGRGIPFVYSLQYDSDSVWIPVTSGGTTTWQPQPNWGWPAPTSAVGYVPTPVVSQLTLTCKLIPTHTYVTKTTRVYSGYVDVHGTLHHAPGLTTLTLTGDPSCTSGQQNGQASTDDGSGYTITIPYGSSPATINATVKTRAGQTFTAPIGGGTPATWALDSNGNEITYNSSTGQFFDTINATTPALTVTSNWPTTTTYTYYAPSGSTQPIIVSYVQHPVQTHFLCSTVGDYGASTPINNYLVDKITYPDGTYYKFTYEPTTTGSPNVTGRIASVTLPSGGTISYTYTGSNGGINCADGTTLGFNRTTPDSATPWQYSRSGSNPNWTTSVTDPLGTVATYNLYELTSTTTNGTTSLSTYTYYERNRTVGPETILTCYNAVYSGCTTATLSLPISQVDKYRTLDSQTSATETKYDTANGGRLTEVKEYDFGVATGAAPSSSKLLRDTVISYAGLTGITDHPFQVTVKDGSGNTKSQTTYTYDQGTPTATSGTPQHTTPSGARGNPTTVTTLVSGSTTLSRSYTYYDTGTVNTFTDVNGALTTYKYGSGTSCGNSFPTEIDLPLSLITYTTWDTNCHGAVPVSTKDVNGNQTTYTYGDPYFWRITAVGYPDGGSRTYTYNTVSTPWNIITTSKKDSATNVVGKVVLDGLGRTTRQEVTSDPNGTSYVDTAFDADGRVESVSNPYYTTGDPTYGVTQYAYDNLSRPSILTHPDDSIVTYSYTGRATMVTDEGNNSGGTTHVSKIFQLDGLGRVLDVCEVSSATLMGSNGTPSACGLDIVKSGFLTTYTYDVLNDVLSVSQPGLNPRTLGYDGLGRLTQEINPESGTTTYYYDGTGQQGDLYQRIRPLQNQTGSATVTSTYTYDQLHRLKQIAYSDSMTPTAKFGYDESNPWGDASTNAKGNMTSAQLDNPSTGAVIAGQGFITRDTMNRVLWSFQNGRGATYSFTSSYDYLGNTTQLINGVEGVTYNYSYDAASRLATLQSSWVDSNHPGTLLTVNTYNALGEPTKETLGNGIVRSLGYDHRGRVTSLADGSLYSYTLGYAPDSVILNGNDSVNGNWTYTYDDFNRILTSGSSSSSFDYKYDRYGNRWQQNLDSGTGGTFTYTFDANSHISTSGLSYDAAGNILNDSFHNYTYDAEGRLLTVDGTSTYVYNAFSERVSATIAGQTYNVAFDPAGNIVDQLNGSTWSRGEVFAGAMHVATYGSSATYFDHSDWLGTVRMRTNLSGASVETCSNLPFGDSQSCAGTDVSPMHFTGQTWDSDSGLTHFWFRQYSPTQGRWMAPDPAGLVAASVGDPQSWNRYAYVGNSPTTDYDPLGLVRNFCTNAGCILGYGGGSCAVVDPSGEVSVTVDGLDSPCGTINSLLATGGASGISGLPPTVFTPGGGSCDLHGWVGEETWYECTGNIFGDLGAANYGVNWNWSQVYLDTKTGTLRIGQQPGPNFNANKDCQSSFLNSQYGPGAQPFAAHFSLFNTFSEQGGLTTIGLEATKLTVGTLAVKAGATAGEVSGAFLIPTGLGTLYDAQARYMCRNVSGANSF